MSVSHSPVYAGFFRRLLASLIDTLIFVALISIVLLLLGRSVGDSILIQDNWLDIFLNNILPIIITVILWHRFKGTPGKLLLNCYVVDAKSGEPPNWTQSIIRYAGYFLSLFSLLLGFLWIIWDKKKQGFHDKLAGTVVVLNDSFNDVDRESEKSLEQLMKEAE